MRVRLRWVHDLLVKADRPLLLGFGISTVINEREAGGRPVLSLSGLPCNVRLLWLELLKSTHSQRSFAVTKTLQQLCTA